LNFFQFFNGMCFMYIQFLKFLDWRGDTIYKFKKLKILSISRAVCHVVHALFVCSKYFLKKNSEFKEFKEIEFNMVAIIANHLQNRIPNDFKSLILNLVTQLIT